MAEVKMSLSVDFAESFNTLHEMEESYNFLY